MDSDVTEAYLDELQGTHIPENENRTTYEKTEDRDKIRTAELAENWEMIIRIRKPRPGEKLLDYGSAWGALGNIAKQSGVVPNGVELQGAGAAFSRTLWGERSTVHQGPIETAPFNDSTFEFVTSFETLEHVFDPVRILTKMKHLVKEDGVVAISVPSAHYCTFKYWFYCKQPLAKWMRRKLPGNMDGSRVLCHNHMITPSLKSARLMMKKAGLKVIYAAPYCSGLSGGSAGKILRIAGKVLWIFSFKQIVFAPSIFLVAIKSSS